MKCNTFQYVCVVRRVLHIFFFDLVIVLFGVKMINVCTFFSFSFSVVVPFMLCVFFLSLFFSAFIWLFRIMNVCLSFSSALALKKLQFHAYLVFHYLCFSGVREYTNGNNYNNKNERNRKRSRNRARKHN